MKCASQLPMDTAGNYYLSMERKKKKRINIVEIWHDPDAWKSYLPKNQTHLDPASQIQCTYDHDNQTSSTS